MLAEPWQPIEVELDGMQLSAVPLHSIKLALSAHEYQFKPI